MGRADTPVRKVLSYGMQHFARHLPIVFVLTVIDRDPVSGALVVRGLYIGDDDECFQHAAALSLEMNFTLVPKAAAARSSCISILQNSRARGSATRASTVPHGHRRRRGIDRARTRRDEVRRGCAHRRSHPEVRVCRHPARCWTSSRRTRPQQQPECRSASDARVVRRPVQHHVLSRRDHAVRRSNGRTSVMHPWATCFAGTIPRNCGTACRRCRTAKKIFYISNPALGLWAHRDRMQ